MPKISMKPKKNHKRKRVVKGKGFHDIYKKLY